MNRRNSLIAGLVIGAAAWLAPLAAQAALALSTITGVVTAVPTLDRIIVDGRAYHIVAGSAAASQRNGVHVGETVDLIFGPQAVTAGGAPGVTAITLHVRGSN